MFFKLRSLMMHPFPNKMLVILFLGFSSGLPLALVGGTLQAWLSDAKIDTATIGKFALIGLPYTVKFLWAPLLDRYALPFLGLRRGWGIVSQLGLCATTLFLAGLSPSQNMDLFSLAALAMAFFSASQDIVVDAYKAEVLEKKEMGLGVGLFTAGYRVAMLVSGGLALILADYTSWTNVYIAMAFINVLGAVTFLCAAEPMIERTQKQFGFKHSLIAPFLEFFKRQGAMEILMFVMIYKLSTLMATSLTTKFLLELGYTKTLIGSVNKFAGLVATIAGTLVGGSLMLKLGLKKSLWIFGLLQALVGLSFCILSRIVEMDGVREVGLVSVISIDNFMMGLGTAAIMAFMMSVCNTQFTGTQFALLSSLTAVTRVILVAQAGVVVQAIGWDLFFMGTVPLSIPGLLLLRRFDTWQSMTHVVSEKISGYDAFVLSCCIISLMLLSSDPIWQWLGHKDVGHRVVVVGAVGMLCGITMGLLKPALNKRQKPDIIK